MKLLVVASSAEAEPLQEIYFESKKQLTLAPILCITLLICHAKRIEPASSNLLAEGYPSLFCRFMNAIAAIFFSVFPLENTARPIPNLYTKRLFEDEVAKFSPELLMGEFSLSVAHNYMLWSTLGLVDDGLIDALIKDMHLLWTNVGLMRIGISMGYRHARHLVEEHTHSYLSGWNAHLEIWHAVMQRLTTHSNTYFARHIPKPMMAKLDRETFFKHVSTSKDAAPGELVSSFDTELKITSIERDQLAELAFELYAMAMEI